MKRIVLPLCFALLSGSALAQVQVDEPWVRATVAQQKATGAFMRLTSPTDARLVGVASPVAGVAEIHEMVMQDNVMKMRPIEALALPAGQAVELRPGGYHVMLLDLRAQVKAGEEVPLSIVVEHAGGQRETIELRVPVRALNAAGGHAPARH
ncbi:copper chaperone PCu(A)C [Pseudothauera nasutitermitis]|uniref:Copper chaperone PCu(A)C n=1 Tax=Pseudothauera nasutitermitis TaxID=2565930 RepID=A0A4S4B7X7_9RHOO|nr:copper chaperone PCu(A)C [Pseudothauera nasutitermitis]THF67113.1 copper chaperone PCu(A)C [Pseudothauera nasutitermitis]